jgi:hypothetical protein
LSPVESGQGELLVAEALTRGHVGDAAITAADDALQRAGRLAVTHGMQKLTARVALTGVLLDALREDPAGALARAHDQLEVWRRFARGNRLIVGLVATAKVALAAERLDAAVPLVTVALELIGVLAWAGPLRGAAQRAAALVAGARTFARCAVATRAQMRWPTATRGRRLGGGTPLGDAPAAVSAGDDGPKLLSAGSTTPAGSSTISS